MKIIFKKQEIFVWLILADFIENIVVQPSKFLNILIFCWKYFI